MISKRFVFAFVDGDFNADVFIAVDHITATSQVFVLILEWSNITHVTILSCSSKHKTLAIENSQSYW